MLRIRKYAVEFCVVVADDTSDVFFNSFTIFFRYIWNTILCYEDKVCVEVIVFDFHSYSLNNLSNIEGNKVCNL